VYTETHSEWIPKEDPNGVIVHWTIGPIGMKPADYVASPPTPATEQQESEITLQLTADQMVQLSVSGTDKYGNPVDISGNAVWQSSDTAIIECKQNKSANPTSCYAIAVGPAGTASVTYTNDANNDGSGDFIGSIAIDVVAGQMAEIVINPGEPESKDASLPPVEGSGERPHIDNTLPGRGSAGGEHPDISPPGNQPVVDPGDLPYVDPRSGKK
jgi:hypothetical protein